MAEITTDQVLENIKKKYGLMLGPLGTTLTKETAISTGNLGIDSLTGVSGLPLGRSVELYGPPSSGKSTTALQAAAVLQKIIISGGDESLGIGPDDKILYLDYEHAVDVNYALSLGLDFYHPSMLFGQPDNFEQGANSARALLETGELRMMIFDSVAAMTPEQVFDNETGKATVALQARLMSEFLKVLNSALHEQNCLAIFLNHIAEAIDMGGRPGIKRYTTPGGRSLKFYASVRVEYQQIGQIKGKIYDLLTNEEQEITVATNVKVKIVKNKVGPPFRQAIVRVRFGAGFDNFWTALQILISHKRIAYSTGYFYFEKSPGLVHENMAIGKTKNQRPYIKGEEAVYTFAEAHPEWRQLVVQAATDLLASFKDGVTQTDQGIVDTATGEILEDVISEDLIAEMKEADKHPEDRVPRSQHGISLDTALVDSVTPAMLSIGEMIYGTSPGNEGEQPPEEYPAVKTVPTHPKPGRSISALVGVDDLLKDL